VGQEDEQADEHEMAATGVGEATGMRDDRQEMALRVGGDVQLAAFDPLARIVAALPPFCRVFTLWLSIMATVGSGSRPALMRTWHRKHRVWCEWPMYTWDIVVMQ
jgi:hypothetical protein